MVTRSPPLDEPTTGAPAETAVFLATADTAEDRTAWTEILSWTAGEAHVRWETPRRLVVLVPTDDGPSMRLPPPRSWQDVAVVFRTL